MKFDYPAPLSPDASENEKKLWDSLFRLIEGINVYMDAQSATNDGGKKS